MKRAKLRLINPKPTLLSPHMQALRHSRHAHAVPGGWAGKGGMFRRLLPVRMFNKPRAPGFILSHKNQRDSADFCASLTHRPEQHETRPLPAFQTFLHRFLSHRGGEPTRYSRSHSTGMCPPSCHLPRPPAAAPETHEKLPTELLESCRAARGFQSSQPRPRPGGDTPRSARHAGRQE